MTETELLLTIASILALGIALWMLSGIIYVKDGTIAVVEKKGFYVGTYTKRWLFFFSPAYEVVGRYPLAPVSLTLEIQGKTYRISYQILDAKTFHYSGHDVPWAISLALKNKQTITLGQIQDVIRAIGCACIEAKGE